MGMRDLVNLEVNESIALVTLNRTPVNALNDQLQDEIQDVFEELYKRNDFGVVIIKSGIDKIFIAGADLDKILSLSSEEASTFSFSTKKMLETIEEFDKVVIAAISGLALGGGCELTLACDIRVADERSVFGFPEVGLGLFPGAGGTQRLPRQVGIGKAKEMIFMGEHIGAKEAKEIGLIERVVPMGEALPEARKIAQTILSRGPIAVSNAKKAIRKGLDLSFKEGLKMETELFSELFGTRDHKEGIQAFIEKRPPRFIGK